MFSSSFHRFADANHLTIGGAGSEKLAMMLIPISPHPWIVGVGPKAWAEVPVWRGFFTEAIATALLVVFILVLLERRSVNAPAPWFFPIALGFGVVMLVFVTAPQTMTSLNPARDLGPRIFLWLYGFGKIAFPGIRHGWSLVVTVVAPIVGGLFGGFFFDLVMRRFFPATEVPQTAAAAGAS
jgi:glycerol uptake facilitator protein